MVVTTAQDKAVKNTTLPVFARTGHFYIIVNGESPQRTFVLKYSLEVQFVCSLSGGGVFETDSTS